MVYEHPNISLESIKAAQEKEATMTNEQNSTISFNPPSHFVYSLRVDLLHGYSAEQMILKWIKKFNVKKYLCAKEFKKDKTPHWQCAMFFKEQPNTNNARNFWRKKTISDKNGHSFKLARNPETLAKYCNDKEEHGILTNLTKEELLQVGTWKSAKQETKKFKEKLDEFIKSLKMKGTPLDSEDSVVIAWFIDSIIDFCFTERGRGIPRHNMLEILREQNVITTKQYRQEKYNYQFLREYHLYN